MEFKRWGMGQSADRVIAPSSFVARGAEAAFQRPCEIIGNGVDPVQFQVTAGERQQARRRFGVEESDPVIVSLAALEERKGLQWVIRALPRLLAEFPSLRYWIVGEGSYRESLEAQIRNLGLERHVWLAGAVANVVPLLAAADVGCLLSKGEAFGITLLEYMAMELPVVTSCHPAFDELVTSSWGEMVTETETGRVARTLAALLRDPLRRRALGRAGRQHVLANYTWDQVADRYLRVLETGERSAGVFSHA
jgi:phosphatidylinositol alpha-1,6-mannosyltransferase